MDEIDSVDGTRTALPKTIPRTSSARRVVARVSGRPSTSSAPVARATRRISATPKPTGTFPATVSWVPAAYGPSVRQSPSGTCADGAAPSTETATSNDAAGCGADASVQAWHTET